jgi:hypothetical protein
MLPQYSYEASCAIVASSMAPLSILAAWATSSLSARVFAPTPLSQSNFGR